jgi:hypothetical protein
MWHGGVVQPNQASAEKKIAQPSEFLLCVHRKICLDLKVKRKDGELTELSGKRPNRQKKSADLNDSDQHMVCFGDQCRVFPSEPTECAGKHRNEAETCDCVGFLIPLQCELLNGFPLGFDFLEV